MGTWYYGRIPWSSHVHGFWLGICHAYGWVFRRKMAVEGVVLRKIAVEEDKFARSAKNFPKMGIFWAKFGQFLWVSGKFCSVGGWVQNFLRRSWYPAAYHVPPRDFESNLGIFYGFSEKFYSLPLLDSKLFAEILHRLP